MAESNPHWTEGHKYAVEGIKVLLALNGGAAVAVLTFAGHVPDLRTAGMRNAILAFGIGALISAFAFLCGYLASLAYGNRETTTDPASGARYNIQALAWHYVGYALFFLAAALFVAGLVIAACSMPVKP